MTGDPQANGHPPQFSQPDRPAVPPLLPPDEISARTFIGELDPAKRSVMWAAMSPEAQWLAFKAGRHFPVAGMDRDVAARMEAMHEELRREESVCKQVEFLEISEEAKRRHEERKMAALTSPDGMAALAEEFAKNVYDSESLDAIPAPEPLISDFLNRGTLARFFGPPKSLKSFVALEMAGCVGTGERFFGHGTRAARVLYIVAEGASGTRARVRAWEDLHGRRMDGVYWYPRAVQVGDAEQMRSLLAYCVTYGFGLVILDTQARSTVGMDENSNGEMGTAIAALDALREETGACVLLVHHSGTEGGRGRGATAFDGAVDSEFEIRRTEGTARVEVRSRFQKDMAEAPVLLVEGVRTLGSLAL
ncbi:AAA family ATPase [Streptomyces sp. NPDC017056]|uniref:AAA family ATPase n=1 Tax=Streptomyces sp. NPDC017056 TaxID=3364973 RepID=UPI0037A2410D